MDVFLAHPLTYKQGTGNRKDLTYIMGGVEYVNWATDMLSVKQLHLKKVWDMRTDDW